MSFDQAAKDAFRNLQEYSALEAQKGVILSLTQAWMNRGTGLYNATGDATEKTQILALRDAMVADLRVTLGV